MISSEMVADYYVDIWSDLSTLVQLAAALWAINRYSFLNIQFALFNFSSVESLTQSFQHL